MTTWLVQLHPDIRRIMSYATRHGIADGGDPGYAVHALLTAAFADRAPKPFRLFDDGRGLLAYSSRCPEELRDAASLALPDVAAALGTDELGARAMPAQWEPGRCFDFELKVRPVRRHRDGPERDVMTVAIERADVLGLPRPDREGAYLDWLAEQFQATGGVELLSARLVGYRSTRVHRKTQAADSGSRRIQRFDGPDALIQGALRVLDASGPGRLIERGIGRHRAFGYGMLLLRPSLAC
jgi:CRISPR system Cascade subunit CasE